MHVNIFSMTKIFHQQALMCSWNNMPQSQSQGQGHKAVKANVPWKCLTQDAYAYQILTLNLLSKFKDRRTDKNRETDKLPIQLALDKRI